MLTLVKNMPMLSFTRSLPRIHSVIFLLALFAQFLLEGCASREVVTGNLTINDGIYTHLAINDVIIQDDSLVTICENQETTQAKALLKTWIKKRIKAVGGGAILQINIYTAGVCKSPYRSHEDRYYGTYDVAFKIIPEDNKNNQYVELRVLADNYRNIANNQDHRDKQKLVHAQLLELIQLLEKEFFGKKEIYFADYIVK